MVWRLLNFFLTPSQRLERCMSIVTSMTTGVSEREANDALNAYVSIILSLNPFLLLWKLLDMIRKMERLQCLGARGWSSCLGLLNQASQLLSVFPNLGVPSLGALKVKVKLLSCVRLFLNTQIALRLLHCYEPLLQMRNTVFREVKWVPAGPYGHLGVLTYLYICGLKICGLHLSENCLIWLC